MNRFSTALSMLVLAFASTVPTDALWATSASLSEPVKAPVVKDMRGEASEGNLDFVLFYARPMDAVGEGKSRAGHAFIAIGQAPNGPSSPSLDQIAGWKKTAYGFWPSSDAPATDTVRTFRSGSVPGEIRLDQILKNDELVLVVLLPAGSDKMAKVREELKAWDTPACPDGEYALVAKDCVRFATSVAKIVGLRVPREEDRKALPYECMKQLAELNR